MSIDTATTSVPEFILQDLIIIRVPLLPRTLTMEHWNAARVLMLKCQIVHKHADGKCCACCAVQIVASSMHGGCPVQGKSKDLPSMRSASSRVE